MSESTGAARVGMLGLYGMPTRRRQFTGFETGFGEIAPRLVERGWDVTIYCRASHHPRDERPECEKGVRLVYVPSPGGKNFSGLIATWFAVAHALLFGRYDLVFFVNVGMGHHAAVCRLLGQRVVMNVDGLDWTRAKWGRVARAYFLSAAHAAMRFCHRLVTDAEAMRRFYLEQFGKETTMIAYGAYVESSENPELIEPFGIRPGNYYLIASRLIPENHADLIAAEFLRSGSSRKLVIAGGANYASDFHRALRALPPERVILTGHIHDSRVIKELHCNCYAYLHGHSVGGTNPSLLKAMGYGNCVLALDTVFNREVLDDCGLFFSREHGVLAALLACIEGDSALVSELRRRGPARIRREYSWEKIASQYEELFREVAAA